MLSKKDLANSACSELELGAFMGIKMKRELTAKGLRQAEVEYLLVGGLQYVSIRADHHRHAGQRCCFPQDWELASRF